MRKIIKKVQDEIVEILSLNIDEIKYEWNKDRSFPHRFTIELRQTSYLFGTDLAKLATLIYDKYKGAYYIDTDVIIIGIEEVDKNE